MSFEFLLEHPCWGAQKIVSPGPYTLSAALFDAANNIGFMKISVNRGRKQPIT
jgi:hypothetical protein